MECTKRLLASLALIGLTAGCGDEPQQTDTGGTALTDTEPTDTALADTALADTEPTDTALADTALADTALADTAPLDADAADAGDADDTDAAEAAPDVPVRVYPLDDVLRLNHVQVKGTHNSYHLEPAFPFDASHAYSHLPLDQQLGDLGVRQFEIDVHYDGDGFFTVFHLPVIDAETTCSTFVDCLETIRTWSDANPYHSPIFIWIEPKDDLDPEPIRGRYDELDAEIRSVFPDRLITPDMVQGDHETLRDAAVGGDWPTLGEVRAHVVFIMLDDDQHHTNYTYGRTTLEGRAMFVHTPDLSAPYAAFVKYNDPIGSGAAITAAAEQGFIVACNAGGIDNSDELVQAKVEAGLAVGAHTLGTDIPGPVGDRYWFDMPSEGVVRCNPVTAPAECTDTAIE
ncbi:MAG: hypothetical protein ACJAYU_001057 [Bradymonadia bacterium]|jgi:hypothetical protein